MCHCRCLRLSIAETAGHTSSTTWDGRVHGSLCGADLGWGLFQVCVSPPRPRTAVKGLRRGRCPASGSAGRVGAAVASSRVCTAGAAAPFPARGAAAMGPSLGTDGPFLSQHLGSDVRVTQARATAESYCPSRFLPFSPVGPPPWVPALLVRGSPNPGLQLFSGRSRNNTPEACGASHAPRRPSAPGPTRRAVAPLRARPGRTRSRAVARTGAVGRRMFTAAAVGRRSRAAGGRGAPDGRGAPGELQVAA